uniref:Uncharacterized protein n=1 Tax=Branchiostoma floridae TaxID=7739 RepID=C3YP77_BRAFL|eukprot:XP_002601956.1 hypothetical protein BRAFLDRAFT_86440 [Branchiostoma floridae]
MTSPDAMKDRVCRFTVIIEVEVRFHPCLAPAVVISLRPLPGPEPEARLSFLSSLGGVRGKVRGGKTAARIPRIRRGVGRGLREEHSDRAWRLRLVFRLQCWRAPGGPCCVLPGVPRLMVTAGRAKHRHPASQVRYCKPRLGYTGEQFSCTSECRHVVSANCRRQLRQNSGLISFRFYQSKKQSAPSLGLPARIELLLFIPRLQKFQARFNIRDECVMLQIGPMGGVVARACLQGDALLGDGSDMKLSSAEFSGLGCDPDVTYSREEDWICSSRRSGLTAPPMGPNGDCMTDRARE